MTQIPTVLAPNQVLTLALVPGGAMITLDRPEMLAGRHVECDVRLPLGDVSRRHARFTFSEKDGWEVEDLESFNGTLVGGAEATLCPLEAIRCKVKLHNGDRVKIGSFLFRVQLPN